MTRGGPSIAAVGTALGPYRYEQADITEAFGRLVTPDPRDRARLDRLHAATGVRARHLALPLDDYTRMDGFAAANDAWGRVAADLGEQALAQALDLAGLRPDEVDVLMTTTVTGVAVPGIDVRLAGRMGMRDDVRRLPLFGLGCVAGAAGVARLADHLVGHRDDVAVLLSVELCSLTVQRDDASPANLVASGLFGDGGAAVVMVGERRARSMGLSGPVVVDSRSRLYPGTERVMGWDIGGSGFRVVLAASVADVVEAHLGDDVKAFLAGHGLDCVDVGRWVAHPGGPKVLQAMARALGLQDEDLRLTWDSLAAVGNLSSASVLHVLRDALDADPPGSRRPAVMLAMGPGFCAELVLLRW